MSSEMAVNTILLDFSVNPVQVKSGQQQNTALTTVENVIREFLSNVTLLTSAPFDGGLLKIFTCDGGVVCNLRIYGNGLLTVTFEYFLAEKTPIFSYESVKNVELRVRDELVGIEKSQALVPLKRCLFGRYMITSDERLLEYDIDRIIFEERTPFQKVQIMHSKSMGNVLVLDDLQNLSEADLIYTESLMCRGKETYKDKDIVILGGGDGALLYELLKEKPRNVVMLEIDEVVMNVCAKHMRSVCGDVLDRRSGPNYRILLGDCMQLMDEFIGEGRKFDYVFGDLTDIPISSTPTGEIWDFILKILEKSFKLLKPDGKYMTHGNGSNCKEALEMYESQVMKLRPPVKINRSSAFVPSFLEEWVFYQISFA